MSPEKCARRGHETVVPVFEHAKFGGVIGWRCMCGATVTGPVTQQPRGTGTG